MERCFTFIQLRTNGRHSESLMSIGDICTMKIHSTVTSWFIALRITSSTITSGSTPLFTMKMQKQIYYPLQIVFGHDYLILWNTRINDAVYIQSKEYGIYLQFQPYPKYIHFILHRSTTWISVSSVSVLSVSGKVSHVLFWKGEKSATEFYLSLILLIEINNKTLSLFLLYFDI